MLKKNLPANLTNTIYQAVNEALIDPVLIKKLASVGDEPASKNPQEFSQFIEKEAKKYLAIAKKANIQVD